MHKRSAALAVAMILGARARADAPQPIAIEIRGPQKLVLAMPLDLQVAATPRVPGRGLSYQCLAVWVQRGGKWVLHREIDPSLGCGVPGGVPGGGEVGHRYEFEKRVHIEQTDVYAKGRLAFPSAGSYRLRLTYHPTCVFSEPNVAVSNEIKVRVVKPPLTSSLCSTVRSATRQSYWTHMWLNLWTRAGSNERPWYWRTRNRSTPHYGS